MLYLMYYKPVRFQKRRWQMSQKREERSNPQGKCINPDCTNHETYRGWAIRDGAPEDKQCPTCKNLLKITLPKD